MELGYMPLYTNISLVGQRGRCKHCTRLDTRSIECVVQFNQSQHVIIQSHTPHFSSHHTLSIYLSQIWCFQDLCSPVKNSIVVVEKGKVSHHMIHGSISSCWAGGNLCVKFFWTVYLDQLQYKPYPCFAVLLLSVIIRAGPNT